jgi:hypothetical protein
LLHMSTPPTPHYPSSQSRSHSPSSRRSSPTSPFTPPTSPPDDLPRPCPCPSFTADPTKPVMGVRCYWALVTPRYPRPEVPGSKLELVFIHLDPVLSVHLARQKMTFIGRGVIEFIHPAERERECRPLRPAPRTCPGLWPSSDHASC